MPAWRSCTLHARRLKSTFFKRGVPELSLVQLDEPSRVASPTAESAAADVRAVLSAASKQVLAAHPGGILRGAYLNALLGDHNLRLPRDPHVSRSFVREIPDAVCKRRCIVYA